MKNKLLIITGAAAAAAAMAISFGSGISYAEDTAGEQSSAYEPVTLNLIVNKEIDDDYSKGFDRDKSKNQFAIRMYEPGGTDENGKFKDMLLPRDTPDEDDPDTNFEEGPGRLVVPLEFSKPGTYEYSFREISPDEGLKDDEGKPMPEETPDMTYDDAELKTVIEIKEKEGKLTIIADTIELSSGGYWGIGSFSNYSNKPKVASAEVYADGKTGTVEYTPGSSYTLTNKVSFENLKPDQTYIAETLVFKHMTPFDKSVNEITSEKSSLDITFNNKITEPDVYNIVTLIKQNDETLYVHNGNFIDFGQMLELKAPKETIPEDEKAVDPIKGCP